MLYLSSLRLDKYTFMGKLPNKDVKILPKKFNSSTKKFSFEPCNWFIAPDRKIQWFLKSNL